VPAFRNCYEQALKSTAPSCYFFFHITENTQQILSGEEKELASGPVTAIILWKQNSHYCAEKGLSLATYTL
jgi:hypothetical protein